MMQANATPLAGQTVCLSIHDYNNIQRKITSYQSRLKACNNLQGLLYQQDKTITYYKEQASKYEGLYHDTEEKLKNMLAQQQLGSQSNIGCYDNTLNQYQQHPQPEQNFPQFSNFDEAMLQYPVSDSLGAQQQAYGNQEQAVTNLDMAAILEQLTENQMDPSYPELKQLPGDLQVDGGPDECNITIKEDEKELEATASKNGSSTIAVEEPVPSSAPGFSKQIFQSIVQDNMRLQRTLKGIMDTGHHLQGALQKSEYEAIIFQLRQELKDIQDKYRDLQAVIEESKQGNTEKVAAIVKVQQNKVTELVRALNLKETLLEGYMHDNTQLRSKLNSTPEMNHETKDNTENQLQKLPQNSTTEEQIENITDQLKNSTLNQKAASPAEPSSRLVESWKLEEERAKLKSMQEELFHLQKEKEKEKEQQKALSVTKNKIVADLDSKLKKEQAHGQKLAKQCQDLEANITDLRDQISRVTSQREFRSAETAQEVAALSKELKESQELHKIGMQQIKMYKEDYFQLKKENGKLQAEKEKCEKVCQQLQGQIDKIQSENEKINRLMMQYQQHIEGKGIPYPVSVSHGTARAASVGARGGLPNMAMCGRPLWNVHTHTELPMVVAQDGPWSSLPGASARQGAGDANPTDGGKESSYLRSTPTKYECPRCQREFTEVSEYRTHCNKCTDS